MAGEPEVDVGSAVLTYRPVVGDDRSVPASSAIPHDLYGAQPMRVFRWYKGQRHYSGEYWSATERDLVPHESRLEKAALMIADFDPTVKHIVSQPFVLRARVNDKWVKHTLDYLLGTDNGPVVVDVVRAERLEHDKIQRLCAWTRRIVQSVGWSYVVFTEPTPVLLNNVRFLSGYRRDWLIDQDTVGEMLRRRGEMAGATFHDAEALFPHHSASLVRSSLLHLLWCHDLTFDVTQRLSRDTVLGRPL